jgi:hypothetical protein
MNTLTITLSNDYSFDKVTIGANISKVSLVWGKDISEWEKSSLQFRLRNFLLNILQKYRNITVLNLSHLDGLKESYYPAKYLYEIYYPDSIESVSFYNNRTLKKISAPGAKEITIKQAPALECIEYGTNLKELTLSETGITHLDLPKDIKLGPAAFKGCEKLESVILRSGTDVPPSTFEDCINLYEVTLPDDLHVIEPNVFSGCFNLRYVYGGKNVKQLFPSAFEGCFNLEMIECKDFYRFTDLNYSDNQWMDKFRPYTPLADVKTQIKKYVQELKEKVVDRPEEYIADNFFHKTEYHYGFVMEYQSGIHGWIVWSLSHNCFFATRGDKIRLQQDDLVTFSIERKPSITIEDSLFIQFPMTYIDESSSLKIIERDGEESDGYEYLLEYFNPRVSFLEHYKKITQAVEVLDIPSIIESYSIKAKTWWQTYPGRDDSQFYVRIAKSDYSDVYLDTLLPQENSEDYYNGCRPIGFDEAEETRKMQASADSEAKSIRESAHKQYSKDAHICKLLEDVINKRRELEKDIEYTYHIQAIKNFFNCRYIASGNGENSLIEFYGYTLGDILKDKKYNDRISWSYKHGWVEENDDSEESNASYDKDQYEEPVYS